VSTGGTLAALRAAGVPALAVSEVTGFPEILDGRVKTLHPTIHAGLLADRRRDDHVATLAEHGIAGIDLLVVNLYPFAATLASGAGREEVVEMIDIGGPAMVRAAAKNHASVAVLVDPADYPRLLAVLDEGDGTIPEALRRELAAKAFATTAGYDGEVARWLSGEAPPTAGELPRALDLALEREIAARYGENPHQPAAIYRDRAGEGVLGGYVQLQGKELSYNNLLDADAARKLIGLFSVEAAVAIVKHNNPCGVGRGADALAAYERALATDPVSAFGSIVAVNREVDADLARALAELFVEVVVAPGVSAAARAVLAERKNLRVLTAPAYRPRAGAIELRAVDGGFLAQAPDAADDPETEWLVPTERLPTPAEREALAFAWKVARYVKSNAIVVTNRDQTVGIGAGQMSRVDSCRLAVDKARLPLAGTVAASDAFFPFRDGLDVLADAGVTAVIHPGGSVRDAEVVAAADERDLALVVTGRRHFRH
jgi:phosphoribosylaminoimidazolecarboxamide formyltransferase/IMP cyclohydrolase